MSDMEGVEKRGVENKGVDRGIVILSALALISAGLTIWVDYGDSPGLRYFFKILTIVLILLITILGEAPPSRTYKRAIIAGLLFSMVGDILLMVPADLFVFGLASFLIGHLFYIFAFITVGGFYRNFWALLVAVLYGIVFMVLLWPNIGEVRIPVIVYTLVILTMAWQAFGQWRQTGEKRALLAFFGAVLFVISDSALALNRFGYPMANAPLIVLGVYYPAQWLIAMSAGAVRG